MALVDACGPAARVLLPAFQRALSPSRHRALVCQLPFHAPPCLVAGCWLALPAQSTPPHVWEVSGPDQFPVVSAAGNRQQCALPGAPGTDVRCPVAHWSWVWRGTSGARPWRSREAGLTLVRGANRLPRRHHAAAGRARKTSGAWSTRPTRLAPRTLMWEFWGGGAVGRVLGGWALWGLAAPPLMRPPAAAPGPCADWGGRLCLCACATPEALPTRALRASEACPDARPPACMLLQELHALQKTTKTKEGG